MSDQDEDLIETPQDHCLATLKSTTSKNRNRGLRPSQRTKTGGVFRSTNGLSKKSSLSIRFC